MRKELYDFLDDNIQFNLDAQDRPSSDPDVRAAQERFDRLYDEFYQSYGKEFTPDDQLEKP